MARDLHTVSIKNGSNGLNLQDRLAIGVYRDFAIPGPVGELTGGVVLNPGSGFTSIPTLAAAGGLNATLTPSMAIATSVAAAAGTTYAPSDTITLTGGTASTQAILEVLTTKIVTAPTVPAAGTVYAPGDTITGTGTGVLTGPVFNVTDTLAASAAVVNGGTGGTPGAVTVTGTTGTGTKFQATGTINGSGVLTGALTITVAGDYTVNPTNLANEPVTNNASATGIVVSVVMGVKTVTIASGGSFSANNTTAGGITQGSTSGSGTGATFTLTAAKYGVNTYTLQNAGSYSALPSNPVSQGSTSGSGSGFTLTVNTWQVQSFTATGGEGYANGAAVTATGGAGTGFAGVGSTNPIGEPISFQFTPLTMPSQGYLMFVQPNGPALAEISAKQQTGGPQITLYPRATSEPVLATSIDVLVLH